jgi:hypothetical protein
MRYVLGAALVPGRDEGKGCPGSGLGGAGGQGRQTGFQLPYNRLATSLQLPCNYGPTLEEIQC